MMAWFRESSKSIEETDLMKRHCLRIAVPFLIVVLVAQPCFAWWEAGHHIVALLAYDLLDREQQQKLVTILKQHPRLAEDFAVPEKGFGAEDRWLVGRAGYWPDVARSQPEFTRPKWHYQLGATLVIGDPQNVPKSPIGFPPQASMDSADLHIAQAVDVCRRVVRDGNRPDAERAVALCWVAHLVGDAHQPCHAGSLYHEKVFPEGDRGGNQVPTKQHSNLHAVWDSLLGTRYDAGDIERRCRTIRSDAEHWRSSEQAARQPLGLDPLTWLAESAEYGRTDVYTAEVLMPVDVVARGLTPKIEPIDLSDDYLKSAGKLARQRAGHAAQRLAAILREDLK
jgi:hypothetical protein